MNPDTDLTFFTNDENQTLLGRFKSTLQDTQFFDVLVGYFRFSGFYQLSDSIGTIQKTRILVGIGVDRTTIRGVDAFRRNTSIDFETPKKTKTAFRENLIKRTSKIRKKTISILSRASTNS